MPAHIDWFLWRIFCSPRYQSSLTEIEALWSLDDMLDAHDVLDMFDE